MGFIFFGTHFFWMIFSITLTPQDEKYKNRKAL